MQARTVTTIATYGLLSLAGGVSLMLPEAITIPESLARPVDDDDTIEIAGVVRDFVADHADFDVPAAGAGHYAAVSGRWLPGNGRPALVAGSYKVDLEWRDSATRPIAPHLSGVSGGTGEGETLGLRVSDSIELKDECVIDSFASTRGPYGVLGNYGNAAYVSTNSTGAKKIKLDKKAVIWGDAYCGPAGDAGTVISGAGTVTGTKGALPEVHDMPAIEAPDATEMEATLGNVTFTAATQTWTGFVPASDDDIDTTLAKRYDKLTIKDNSNITIVGDLRVVCKEFKLEKNSQISLAPDAHLTLFVLDNHDVTFDDQSLVNYSVVPNADVDTASLTVNYLGTKKVVVKNKSHVYATIIAPAGALEVKDEAHMYGAFVGKSVKLDGKGQMHVDAVNGDRGKYNPAILVRDKVELEDKSNIDSFDSTLGAYDGPPPGGGTNWGEDALVQTNSTKNDKIKVKDKCKIKGDVLVGVGGNPSTVIKLEGSGTITGSEGSLAQALQIPTVAPPALGASVGDKTYSNGTFALASNLRCKKLKLDKATLEISGDVVIRVDDKVEMKDKSTIVLLPGARLTLFVAKEMLVEDRCEINTNTGDPKLVSICRSSLEKKGKIHIKKQSDVVAWIQGAQTELIVEDNSEFFGTFMGDKVKVKKDSAFHLDMAYLIDCLDVDDTPGTAGAAGNGSITSAASYDEWFRDVLGVNQSKVHTITLTRTASVYEYLTTAFHPIDSMLLGNEGKSHNENFTYAIKADFIYEECGGQFVEFEGGDGAWMYVNGQLVIDLGGLRNDQKQYIEMDRLGLDGDREYTVHFFYAQRRADLPSKTFKLRTNIELSTADQIPGTLDMFD